GAEGVLKAVNVMPTVSVMPAAAASETFRPRRRAAAVGGWVTCISPYLGWRRRMWVRPAARECGHASRDGGITAWPQDSARMVCKHQRSEKHPGIRSEVQQPGPNPTVGACAAPPRTEDPRVAATESVFEGG